MEKDNLNLKRRRWRRTMRVIWRTYVPELKMYNSLLLLKIQKFKHYLVRLLKYKRTKSFLHWNQNCTNILKLWGNKILKIFLLEMILNFHQLLSNIWRSTKFKTKQKRTERNMKLPRIIGMRRSLLSERSSNSDLFENLPSEDKKVSKW